MLARTMALWKKASPLQKPLQDTPDVGGRGRIPGSLLKLFSSVVIARRRWTVLQQVQRTWLVSKVALLVSRSSSRDEVFSQLQRRGVEAFTEGQSRGGRGQESSTREGGSSSSCQAVGKCSLEERESCGLFTLKVPVSPSFLQPSKATDHPEESTVLHFPRHPPSVHSCPDLSIISSPSFGSIHPPALHAFLTCLPPLIFPLPLLESGGSVSLGAASQDSASCHTAGA